MTIKQQIKNKLTEAMQKNLDFKAKAEKAKTMSVASLNYAIKDCLDTIEKGMPEDRGYYTDEISVYRQELVARKKAEENAAKKGAKKSK